MKYLIAIILLVITQYAHAISLSMGVLNGAYGIGNPRPPVAWTFLNTPEEAILIAGQSIFKDGGVYGILDFYLHEPVNYAIESLSYAILNDGGSLHTSIWFSDPGFVSPYPPPVYASGVTDSSQFASIRLTDSGILDTGHYWFEYKSSVNNGNAGGILSFTMNRVPDAGSTLLLMSLGLGAIGIWRHRTV